MRSKIVFMCGSHRRHLYIASKLLAENRLAALVVEEREEFVPTPNPNWNKHYQELFNLHFKERDEAEKKFFSEFDTDKVLSSVPLLKVTRDQLNSLNTINFLKNFSGNFLFTYGVHKISEDLISLFSNKSFNIHGGLSPWYRGCITLFWPFYFLKPNYAGMTIHRLSQNLDGGDILHHSMPTLEYGDKMHEVACKAVLSVADDLCVILDKYDSGNEIICQKQMGSGKLFVSEDWTPQNLVLIYDVFKDQIVDRYLDGTLIKTEPKLVKFF